ncbi:hypothetical protein LOZ80_25570 [Paenibacillus sp. HWE-109]|uniref:hypothetical protein n=1 Tax=Paenibacillus sp. HWE-109 TaxID=1306526 RepID=UPI001EDFB907|nr:hypothetical protein [Paenibacillus sp. HWE-109]UKS24956.1 hypothetical protein LOZ80_25570 [Paenibacillus sp. HWE-109]
MKKIILLCSVSLPLLFTENLSTFQATSSKQHNTFSNTLAPQENNEGEFAIQKLQDKEEFIQDTLPKKIKDISGLKLLYQDVKESEIITVIIRIKQEVVEEEFERKMISIIGKKVKKEKMFNYSVVLMKSQLIELDAIDEVDFYTLPSEASYLN